MTSDIPNCHGFTRAIEVTAPKATIVNSIYPAPTGARGITGYRIIDCMFGALAAVLPERVTADGMGGSSIPAFGGWHNGRPFVFSETMMGTWGAALTHDGQEGVPHMGANQANVPVEMIEANFPLRIKRYGIVADTGGAGRFRGGNSLIREYEYLAEAGVLTLRSDKRDFPPHGLDGGRPGAGPISLFNPGPQQIVLPVLVTESLTVKCGDILCHTTPSGGGRGNPLERDPAMVLEDVFEGKVSPEHARAAYGVVIVAEGRDYWVDQPATQQLRESLAQH
jgi:N-methylhydantoinase B